MRITRVYTKIGDQGQTQLGDGQTVPKNHPRVASYGAVDEANAAIGCARAQLNGDALDPILEEIQHRLFDTGGLLCAPGFETPETTAGLTAATEALEARMDQWCAAQGPLEEFILPGGTPAAAFLHQARTIVRRAERETAALAEIESETVPDSVLIYLNRLSDALFVMAREANRTAGRSDVTWKK